MSRAALAGLFLWAFAAGAEPRYRAAVEVLLDASRGALQTQGGRPLWDLEVSALTKALEKTAIPEGSELVVRTMGGEPGARCEATRPLVPPGGKAAVLLGEEAANVKPQGPRPLVTALEGAASDLAATSAVRSVVLLTTGTDGCGRDACAAARDLRRDPGLGSVRVIGVGTEGPKSLACLGLVQEARTAEALEARLREALEAAFVPAELAVEVTDNGLAVRGDVEVYQSGDEVPISRGRGGATFALGGGSYDVKVSMVESDGAASREGWRRGVELASASRVALRVPLGKGPARLLVHVRLNGADAPDGTRVFLHPPGDRANEVATGWPDEPIVAPPGRYDVRASIPGSAFGNIEVWKPSTVLEAGSVSEVRLDARQKLGSVRAIAVSGAEQIDEAAIEVLANGGRGSGDSSLAPGEETLLPAGTYTLAARLDTPGGPLVGFKDDVRIGPDERADVTVEMAPSGTLEVEVAGNPLGLWNVALLRPGETRASTWMEAGAPYRVPAGKYDLRLENDSGVAKRVVIQRGIVIAPGERRHVLVQPR